MPPKGWSSGRPEGFVKAVRLSQDMIDRVAQHVERLQVQLSYVRVNEAMALRHLIETGLNTVEASALPVPLAPAIVRPAPQPALPVPPLPAPDLQPRAARVSLAAADVEDVEAMPLVPATTHEVPATTHETQPPLVAHETLTPEVEQAPAAVLPMAPPGMQNCFAGLRHPAFSLTIKGCPRCRNNEAARKLRANKKAGART